MNLLIVAAVIAVVIELYFAIAANDPFEFVFLTFLHVLIWILIAVVIRLLAVSVYWLGR